jgi:hypothetical protein
MGIYKMKLTGTLRISDTNPLPAGVQLYRKLHDAEMSDYPLRYEPTVMGFIQQVWNSLWRTGVPEVYPYSDHRTELTKEYQLLSYRINTTENPLITANMTPQKWRAVYDDHRWGMNGSGGYEAGHGGDVHCDWINMRDLTAPPPKFDKFRGFGGQLYTGVETNGMLAIETLRVQDQAPSLEWLLARPWLYMDALNVTSNGCSKFPQGTNGNRVFVLNLSSQQEFIPLNQLQKLPLGYDVSKHDAYKIYNPV